MTNANGRTLLTLHSYGQYIYMLIPVTQWIKSMTATAFRKVSTYKIESNVIFVHLLTLHAKKTCFNNYFCNILYKCCQMSKRYPEFEHMEISE